MRYVEFVCTMRKKLKFCVKLRQESLQSFLFFDFTQKKQHNQFDCQPLNTTMNHFSNIKNYYN